MCTMCLMRIVLLTFCVMHHDAAKCHFLGVAHPSRGLSSLNSNSAEIFVQCTYPQVSSSCIYSFRSYRVDRQTHKQTNRRHRIHPTFFAMLRRWLIKASKADGHPAYLTSVGCSLSACSSQHLLVQLPLMSLQLLSSFLHPHQLILNCLLHTISHITTKPVAVIFQ